MPTPLAAGYGYSGQAKHRMSFGEVKQLAEAFGLPGTAIAQIARGESSLYADIQQHDPGDGMVGYGLLQMTPNAWGKGSAAFKYMQHLGGVQAMKDPVKNMAMARFLYKAAGNKLSPWYGTRFLTNRSGEGKLGPIDHSRISAGLANAVSGTGSSGQAPGGGSTRTITTTTPGVDNRVARAALIQSFLDDRNADPVNFAMQARGLADVAPTTSSRTVRTPGTPGSTAGPDVSGGSGDLAASAAQRANAIDAQQLPYSWGGGHGGQTPINKAVPLDCSGAVSKVLGIDPRVSGQFGKWGRPGDGGSKGVTIYSNGHHVLMKINGHFFGTSHSNPGGGAGWIPQSAISPGYLKGFTVRHSSR